MSKKPKPKNAKEKSLSEGEQDVHILRKPSSISEDQIERGYYYDDAYGYQKYEENDEDEEDETN